ncbi:hypothetical protein N9C03_00365 [bacterium]|nr:hypothetical protein [bacterium]
MTRTLPTSVIDALDDNVVYPFFAIELNFDGADVLRLWTGIGTLNVQGVDWTGAGTLLNVSSIEETTEIAAKGATLSLTGIPSEVVSLALSTPYQGRTCKIYFGLFKASKIIKEDSSFLLLEDGSKIYLEDLNAGFTEIFSGYMDQMDIEELPETSTIQLRVENKLVDLERARVARYSSSYQKSIYPTDFGLDLVESLQDKEIVWGRGSFKPSDASLNAIARTF